MISKKIDGYTKQKKALQDNAKALQDVQSHIKNLRQQMSVSPSTALTKKFEKSVGQSTQAKTGIRKEPYRTAAHAERK